MDQKQLSLYFSLFNEIGIVSQLSRALLDARLPEGLIGPHFAVLNHLIRVGDGRTPQELASAFQIPKTSLTNTLAVLEKHRLIKMKPNPKDGRSKCVWLTKKGEDTRNHTITDLAPKLMELLGDIPFDKIEILHSEMQNIRKIMDTNRD